jgi:hypothetical protein
MRTTIDVTFLPTTPGRGVQGFARKVVDLPFMPVVGMDINDPAWKDTKRVTRVTLMLKEDPSDSPELHVQLEDQTIADKGNDSWRGPQLFAFSESGWTLTDHLAAEVATWRAAVAKGKIRSTSGGCPAPSCER